MVRETYSDDDDGTITGVPGQLISSTEVCGRCGLETPKARLNELGNCNRKGCRDEYDRDMPTREEEAAEPSSPDVPGWAWGSGDWDD
jgi:hypothetical protein